MDKVNLHKSIPKTLLDILKTLPPVALGFSSGVDSSYLLYALKAINHDVKAYFIKSEFQPAFELEDARNLANELNAKLEIIELSSLAHEEIANNDQKRCYYCKKNIFSTITSAAKRDGYSLIVDGSNADDDAGDRPGMQALTELQVRSPLREAGLTKVDIRRAAKEAGLFTWNKPAYACLATRIPAGTPIDLASLEKVEAAEKILANYGMRNFRARKLNDAVKLELGQKEALVLRENRQAILADLKPYFPKVYLDLNFRPEEEYV